MSETIMNIDLLNLSVDVKYEHEVGGYTGVTSPDGGREFENPWLNIYSIKCNGIELIDAIDKEQIEELEQDLLSRIT